LNAEREKKGENVGRQYIRGVDGGVKGGADIEREPSRRNLESRGNFDALIRKELTKGCPDTFWVKNWKLVGLQGCAGRWRITSGMTCHEILSKEN